MLVYGCVMIMLMLCKSSYARLTPEVLQGICHSALSGRTVARRHVADARAVTLNIVIHEVEETGGSIAHHPHEFRCKRGQRQHPLEPLGVRVRGGREAVGEPVAWRSRRGQRVPP